MKKKKLLMLIPLAIFFVLVALFIKDIIMLWPNLFKQDADTSEALLEGFGWKGVIYLVLIQAVQMLLVFIPSEFLQIISGATYGVLYGTLVCWAGLVLGATIIFLLVRVLNFKVETFKKGSDSEEIISSLNSKKKSAFYITLVLFFLPAIPYGLICYFSSGTKISYPKYVLACIIGVLPSVLIDSLLGNVAINLIGKFLWPILIGFVVIMILFIWLVNKYSQSKVNKVVYGTSKPTMDMILKNRQIKTPTNVSAKLFFKATRKIFKKRNNVSCDNNIEHIEAPYVALCSHLSFYDFIYTTIALNKDSIPNIVANRQYFNTPILKFLFDKGEVIPKNLFTSDLLSVKHMMKVIKSGNGLIMMPEGRLSISGTNQPMPQGLGKLLKKLNVTVLGIIPHGAYLTGAKWMECRHKGAINIESKVLISQDQLSEMTAEEIEEKVIKELEFDEFEWVKQSGVKFKSKNMLKGIDGILYHCPNCHSEFTLFGHKNDIVCSHCGNIVTMDDKFEFINPPLDTIHNIKDWYNYQIDIESKEVQKEDFKLVCDVTAKTYDPYGKGLKKMTNGVCELTREGLRFTSTEKPEFNAFKSAETMQSLLFGCKEDFETYIDDKFYYFVPTTNKQICTKFAICSEQIHKNL